MTTLAKRIRDCRYVKGWGPDELAQRADISRTALYQIECGKTETPRAGTIRRIAKALEVPVDRLLGPDAFDGDAAAQSDVHDEYSSPWHERESIERELEPVGVGSRHAAIASTVGLHQSSMHRETEVILKLREILASPLGEGLCRIVEESYRLLPAVRS
jgi:transcriptional regulator with XRE-family HTH domain